MLRASMYRFVLLLSICVAAACGPSSRGRSDDCVGGACSTGVCNAGETRACYSGAKETENVGPCGGGVQTCTQAGEWGTCEGEVVPQGEVCGNGVDDNCNGQVDEDVDLDGDGFTTCGGDCCDSSTVCGNPAEVNPSAFDVAGDGVDNDCDGKVDNAQTFCDQALHSGSTSASDYAQALDICQTATMQDKKWGVLDAALTLPDGQGTPDPNQYSIRHHFGAHVMPEAGVSMVLLSTGTAAGKQDTAPAYHDPVSYMGTKTSGFPADFLAANNGELPNAPGCPKPISTSGANDPVMLTLHLRVPSNAHSFSMKTNFFSSEFPEWTCSQFNDFFVVLLDSQYQGNPANPADKNLAIYREPATGAAVPVGVNLAHGDTGLFTQCVNGTTGCAAGHEDAITTCMGTDELASTGFDDPSSNACDAGSTKGGATGWLTTTGNVVPGEIITLRIAIWDTSDHAYDSLAVIDGFQWSADSSTPGTVIFRSDQPNNPFAVDAADVFRPLH
jgi:hypothetical protein